MRDMPYACEENWAVANAECLQKWKEATTPEATDRALRWFVCLPQLLLRQPRRGGRAGANVIKRR